MNIEYTIEIIRGAIIIGVAIAAWKGWLKDWVVWFWVVRAVKAVEVIIEGTGMGAQKKAEVIKFITSKFKISVEDLNRLIEAAVMELHIQQGRYK